MSLLNPHSNEGCCTYSNCHCLISHYWLLVTILPPPTPQLQHKKSQRSSILPSLSLQWWQCRTKCLLHQRRPNPQWKQSCDFATDMGSQTPPTWNNCNIACLKFEAFSGSSIGQEKLRYRLISQPIKAKGKLRICHGGGAIKRNCAGTRGEGLCTADDGVAAQRDPGHYVPYWSVIGASLKNPFQVWILWLFLWNQNIHDLIWFEPYDIEILPWLLKLWWWPDRNRIART